MGLFSGTPRSPFTAAMLRRLEMLCRDVLDIRRGVVDGPDAWDHFGPLRGHAAGDRGGLSAGLAAFGAARVVGGMYNDDCFRFLRRGH